MATTAAPLIAAYIGLAYVFGDPQRTMATTFDAAKSIASMQAWGCVFLFCAATLAGWVLYTPVAASHFVLADRFWKGQM